MACKHDGMGSWLAFTVTEDGQCTTTGVSLAQALIDVHTGLITAGLLIKLRDAPPWSAEIGSTETPNVQDGIGTFVKKRFAGFWSHEPVEGNFDWPWDSDFDPTLLLGARGTLRSNGPDGSYFEGAAKVTMMTMQPNRDTEDATGTIRFEWEGGSTQPSYTKV